MTPPPTQQDTSGVRVFPPLITLVAMGLGFLVQWVVPIRFGATRLAAQAAGCLLLGLGVGLIAWTAALMFRSGTTPNPTRPTTALVIRGPFRFTRNPMYLALVLIGIGVGFVANAVWPALMAIPAAVVLRLFVIDKEERYLERKFGSEYRAYLSRVHRWL